MIPKKYSVPTAVCALIAAVTAAILLMIGGVPLPFVNAAPAQAAATNCVTDTTPVNTDVAPNGVTYYAYNQAIEGEFGNGTKSTNESEVITWAGDKLTHDPLFAATVVTASQLPADTKNVPKVLESKFNDIETTANTYVNDHTAWAGALKTLYSDAASCKLNTYNVKGFDTLEMHVNKAAANKPAPKLTFNSVSSESLGESFDIIMKNGLVLHLRTICGGQPSQPFQASTPIRGPTTAPTTRPAPPTPTSSTVPPTTRPSTPTSTTPPTHTTTPPPTSPPTTTHTTPPPTCLSVYGPGYSGTYPNCHKDPTGVIPTPPTSAPATNPAPNPTSNPGSNKCYSNTTGLPVSPNPDGSCPPGSFGG